MTAVLSAAPIQPALNGGQEPVHARKPQGAAQLLRGEFLPRADIEPEGIVE